MCAPAIMFYVVLVRSCVLMHKCMCPCVRACVLACGECVYAFACIIAWVTRDNFQTMNIGLGLYFHLS